MKNDEYIFDLEERAFQIRQWRDAAAIFCLIFASGFFFGAIFGALVM